MTFRYGIVGAGAIGGSVAADLINSGLSVVIIDSWRDHVAAIRRHGLVVDSPDGTQRVAIEAIHTNDLHRLPGPLDVAFMCVKAYDSRAACQSIAPYLRDGAAVIGLQNGMTSATIADVVGRDRSVAAVVELAATLVGPGAIRRNTARSTTWFAVGASPDSQARVAAVEALRSSGRVEVISDIEAAKWTKLIVNCMLLAPTAVLDVNVGAVPSVPELGPLMDGIGREALAVCRAGGYELKPVFGLQSIDHDSGDRHLLQQLINTVVSHIGPNAVGVTLTDLRHGRRSEVAEINGWVVRKAQSLGLTAPWNDAVVRVAQRIEQGSLSPCRTNHTLILDSVGSSGL